MTGSGKAQIKATAGEDGKGRPAGVLRATWLIAAALAKQLAARIDDRLARRLSGGHGGDR